MFWTNAMRSHVNPQNDYKENRMKNNTLPLAALLSTLALFTISLSACNEDEKPEPQANDTTIPEKTETPTAESLKAQLNALKTEIDTTIGSADCSNSKQCSALAIGHKACGGPMTYIPYSTENTDTTKLLELSEQHQQRNKELNQLTGMMSDCMMVMQPAFICRDNRCQK